MSSLEFTQTDLRDGVWQGVVTGALGTKPQLEVTHENVVLPEVTLTQDTAGDHWVFSMPLPASVVSDGVNTLTIRDIATDDKIGHITLIAGEAAGDDLRAEVDLLRAELDMLKRAFRRHCNETR